MMLLVVKDPDTGRRQAENLFKAENFLRAGSPRGASGALNQICGQGSETMYLHQGPRRRMCKIGFPLTVGVGVPWTWTIVECLARELGTYAQLTMSGATTWIGTVTASGSERENANENAKGCRRLKVPAIHHLLQTDVRHLRLTPIALLLLAAPAPDDMEDQLTHLWKTQEA